MESDIWVLRLSGHSWLDLLAIWPWRARRRSILLPRFNWIRRRRIMFKLCSFSISSASEPRANRSNIRAEGGLRKGRERESVGRWAGQSTRQKAVDSTSLILLLFCGCPRLTTLLSLFVSLRLGLSLSVSHSICLSPFLLSCVQHPSLLSAAVKCDNLIVL